ncbi:MAG: hypothetical protein Pg6A_06930 [Termitinemataceae bacterium]|nr:MAG: hypothetical protein Pg6A_06930 [Termitinemataceae bacterium]
MQIVCESQFLRKSRLQTPAQAIEAEFASEAKQIVAESAFFAGGRSAAVEAATPRLAIRPREARRGRRDKTRFHLPDIVTLYCAGACQVIYALSGAPSALLPPAKMRPNTKKLKSIY